MRAGRADIFTHIYTISGCRSSPPNRRVRYLQTKLWRFNISPETVNCACCSGDRVPEIGYPVCSKRRGLIPRTLEPLLRKRVEYKQRRQQAASEDEREMWDRRQSAHKWMLVTCFGYLGYKNARFGKIEAHESVTAYSREILLQAKEIAEREGFSFIHAIVDSLWLQKPGATEVDYERLAELSGKQTGLPIAVEGVYKWIVFPPSRMNPRVAVHNRFYGLFSSGKQKVRGLELRRHDTPSFVKAAQRGMLEVLSTASDREEFERAIPKAIEVLRGYLDRLKEGDLDPRELVIRTRLSQEPAEFRNNTFSAIVSRRLLSAGVSLSPGEQIEYVVTDHDSPVPEERARPFTMLGHAEAGYDIDWYTKLLLRAAESLLSVFGYDVPRLKEMCWLASASPAPKPGRAWAGLPPKPKPLELPFP